MDIDSLGIYSVAILAKRPFQSRHIVDTLISEQDVHIDPMLI